MDIFIKTIKIYNQILSITLDVTENTDNLQYLIRKPLRFTVYVNENPDDFINKFNGNTPDNIKNTVWFKGKIVSVGRNYFVIHTKINMIVLFRLIKAKESPIKIKIDKDFNGSYVHYSIDKNIENKNFNEKIDNNAFVDNSLKNNHYSLTFLKTILCSASKKFNIQEEELIYRFTTYTKNGRTYEGKKNLDEVSEKQKVILYDKIKKLLREKKPESPSSCTFDTTLL